jgi:hypothetical protein
LPICKITSSAFRCVKFVQRKGKMTHFYSVESDEVSNKRKCQRSGQTNIGPARPGTSSEEPFWRRCLVKENLFFFMQGRVNIAVPAVGARGGVRGGPCERACHLSFANVKM